MSLFFSLEGGDGSGKTTLADRLVRRLQDNGYRAVTVQEPGSTELGIQVRAIVKEWQDLTLRAELALFAAARAELVDKVLRPELERGTILVADRYVDSTTAYQGYGRGLSLDFIRSLNTFVIQDLLPHRTFLLDIDPVVGLRRAGLSPTTPWGDRDASEGRLGGEGHRFEDEPMAFHQRVRAGYRSLAEAEPGRFVVLDATLPLDVLEERLWQTVEPLARQARP